jgi:hypothetical protein
LKAAWKVAVTLDPSPAKKAHAVFPEQTPVHPTKVDRGPAVATSRTCAPLSKVAVQVGGQEIAAGRLVTLPLVPDGCLMETVMPACLTNSATADSGPAIVTEQGSTEQAPLQPAKRDPAAGAAVSVTFVPGLQSDEQLGGHAIPGWSLVTVPAPVLLPNEIVSANPGESR